MTCLARQHSDQMTCACGNAWDVNDPDPPACRPVDQPLQWTQEEWDAFFYVMAEHAATRSKDPDRRVGAVLVSADRRQVSFGYNGFPPEIPDLPSLLADRDFKREHMLHAERNCLAQSPFPTPGCSLYVTRFPCFECAGRILGADVARIVAPAPDFNHPRWGQSWWLARQALWNGAIEITRPRR